MNLFKANRQTRIESTQTLGVTVLLSVLLSVLLILFCSNQWETIDETYDLLSKCLNSHKIHRKQQNSMNSKTNK